MKAPNKTHDDAEEQAMTRTNHLANYAAATTTATLLTLVSALPAAARPWPGDPLPQHPDALTRHDQISATVQQPDTLTRHDKMSVSAVGKSVTDVRLRFSWHEHNCPLRRVGSQLVRCDNLTGAGATAPDWVPEL
jgi:hypothetical protein